METDFFSRHRASQRRDFVGEAVTVLRESLLNVQNSGAAQNHDLWPDSSNLRASVASWFVSRSFIMLLVLPHDLKACM